MGNCQTSHNDETGPELIQEIMLFKAIINQDVEEVKARIRLLTNVNCVFSGKTPLNAACVTGNATITKLLLQAGANPNNKDGDGMSPLYSIMLNDHVECLELLLKYGATVPRYVEGLPVATYAATVLRSISSDGNRYLVAARLKQSSPRMTKAEADYFNMITSN